MGADIKQQAEKYALQNAVKFGSARPDAVAKKLLAIFPELRSTSEEVMKTAEEAVKKANELGAENARKKLEEIAPELLVEERKEPNRGPPELEHKGKVVMRFAPNPNGPPTLGSARGIVINAAYAKRYSGKFIIRFDDTDPLTKKPLAEAYQWYLEDCEWLGAKPDEVVYASERIETYYGYAEELISKGAAYVCTCPKEWFKSYKDAGQACTHRATSVEENRTLWKNMLGGAYKEGEAVLRIKTDMTHPNPALRDWVAFRVIRAAHPRVEHRYTIWPTLDFESAIEDHLLGTTHILRGKDLADSEKRQEFVYNYMGWDYPETLLWGKIKIHEFGKFSTSLLRKDIENGKYTGWDDPKLPTLRALQKRGIKPEAVWNFMLSLGLGENELSISMENLYAENRKLIDPIANRYFFVWSPVKMEVPGVGKKVAKVHLHPDRNEMKNLSVDGSVFVCQEDTAKLKPGDKIRLKDFCNVEIISTEPLKVSFAGEDVVKGIRIIQWTPTEDKMNVRVITPDGEITGFGESGIKKEVGNVVQFERFGFVRIDSIEDGTAIAYFTHE
jgi:glutamyl-tRNA synthetase